jgi:DNA-binding NarL/FixJ family response regulator
MKVLIVDDHPLVREALAGVVAELDPAADTIQAESAEAALTALAAHQDLTLCLLDLMLPDADGTSVLARIRTERPEVPVVVLSAHDTRPTVLAAIDAGAMGFISKRSPTSVLVEALRLVLVGGVYLPPELLRADPSPAIPAAPSPSAGGRAARTAEDLGLTRRQIEVLALLVQGKPNKLICRELQLAEGTVKTHAAAIFRALGVSNRTQAVFALGRLGIQLPFPPVASATSSLLSEAA